MLAPCLMPRLPLPQLGSLSILVPLADLHPRTRPTDEPPFSGTFLKSASRDDLLVSGSHYCRRKYYFRTVTGSCSVCLRLDIVAEPLAQ